MTTVTVEMIKNAQNTNDVAMYVDRAMDELGCEFDASSSFGESAEWFEQEGEDGVPEAAEILRAEEARWFELEA